VEKRRRHQPPGESVDLQLQHDMSLVPQCVLLHGDQKQKGAMLLAIAGSLFPEQQWSTLVEHCSQQVPARHRYQMLYQKCHYGATKKQRVNIWLHFHSCQEISGKKDKTPTSWGVSRPAVAARHVTGATVCPGPAAWRSRAEGGNAPCDCWLFVP